MANLQNMSGTKDSNVLAKEILDFIIRMKEGEKVEKLQKQDVVQRYILDRNTKTQINEALEILVKNGNIVFEPNDDVRLIEKEVNFINKEKHSINEKRCKVFNDNREKEISNQIQRNAMKRELSVKNRKEFLQREMQWAQAFNLSKEEVSLGFEYIDCFVRTNGHDAFCRMKAGFIKPEEPLSERQAVCSENAIRCLFEQDYVQALHETLDVLSDYNKKTELSYNECSLLKNILLTYQYLKDR